MENKKEKIGFKIKDSSNITIEDCQFEGLDTAIDANNVNNLKTKDILIKNKGIEFYKKWYKNPIIIIPAIITLIGIITSFITTWLWH